MSDKMKATLRMVLAAMFLALCMILPFLGGQIQPILNKFSPMHFPVMICAIVCGWKYAAVIGFVAPLLRSVIFGMPPMLPTAAAMAFEMAAYGVVIGLLYRLLPKKTNYLYVALVAGMIVGRVVWGVVSVPLYGMVSKEFTVMTFLMGAFINAIPAIILQLIIIPAIVIALQKAGLLKLD